MQSWLAAQLKDCDFFYFDEIKVLLFAFHDILELPKSLQKLLRYFGLQDFANKKPLTLSGGEKQRVAIARSLINNPKIIFADEPTGNLDSKNSKILFDLFFKLRDDYNCSVVIVTHDENSANKCDRKLLIVDGKIKNQNS